VAGASRSTRTLTVHAGRRQLRVLMMALAGLGTNKSSLADPDSFERDALAGDRPCLFASRARRFGRRSSATWSEVSGAGAGRA
jgi:hypothetical protein